MVLNKRRTGTQDKIKKNKKLPGGKIVFQKIKNKKTKLSNGKKGKESLCMLLSKLYHINARPPALNQGVGERSKPPGLPQQELHASIRALESTSIPTGDVELSTSASTMRLARFTNALATSHSPLLHLRARTPQSQLIFSCHQAQHVMTAE